MASFWMIFFILIVCAKGYAPDGYRDQSPPTPQSQFVEFPKILWTYWDNGMDGAKIWTKLCLNNLHHFSRISGYELRFLTDQNYTNYLSKENNELMQSYVDLLQKNHLGIQGKSDLLRVFLMYQHGGMYLDGNSFFTRDFGWVSKLYEWPWVYNRISPNPQVLLFTMRKQVSYLGNQSKVFDQKTGQNVMLFPKFQNWFMLARPNSLLFTKMIETMGISLEKGMAWMVNDHKARGIDYYSEYSNYFLLGNFQLSMLVHLKQVQLDAAESPPTRYAVDYYKLWNMYSQSSGYFFFLQFLQQKSVFSLPTEFSQEEIDDMFQYPTQLLLVKSFHTTTVQYQKRILEIYNKSCVEVSHQILPQSLFYQTMINISSIFPEVDSLKKTLEYNEGKCNVFSQTTDTIQLVFDAFKYVMVAAFVGFIMIGPATLVLKLVRGNEQKS